MRFPGRTTLRKTGKNKDPGDGGLGEGGEASRRGTLKPWGMIRARLQLMYSKPLNVRQEITHKIRQIFVKILAIPDKSYAGDCFLRDLGQRQAGKKSLTRSNRVTSPGYLRSAMAWANATIR